MTKDEFMRMGAHDTLMYARALLKGLPDGSRFAFVLEHGAEAEKFLAMALFEAAVREEELPDVPGFPRMRIDGGTA